MRKMEIRKVRKYIDLYKDSVKSLTRHFQNPRKILLFICLFSLSSMMPHSGVTCVKLCTLWVVKYSILNRLGIRGREKGKEKPCFILHNQ